MPWRLVGRPQGSAAPLPASTCLGSCDARIERASSLDMAQVVLPSGGPPRARRRAPARRRSRRARRTTARPSAPTGTSARSTTSATPARRHAGQHLVAEHARDHDVEVGEQPGRPEMSVRRTAACSAAQMGAQLGDLRRREGARPAGSSPPSSMLARLEHLARLAGARLGDRRRGPARGGPACRGWAGSGPGGPACARPGRCRRSSARRAWCPASAALDDRRRDRIGDRWVRLAPHVAAERRAGGPPRRRVARPRHGGVITCVWRGSWGIVRFAYRPCLWRKVYTLLPVPQALWRFIPPPQ